jgi:CrcB protein
MGKDVLAVALGGAVGALTRYLLSGLTWGTLWINLAGSFGLGLFLGMNKHWKVPERLRLGVATGFFGSFTTFSTFSKEAIGFLANHHLLSFILYLSASIVGGLALAWLGSQLAGKLSTERKAADR